MQHFHVRKKVVAEFIRPCCRGLFSLQSLVADLHIARGRYIIGNVQNTGHIRIHIRSEEAFKERTPLLIPKELHGFSTGADLILNRINERLFWEYHLIMHRISQDLLLFNYLLESQSSPHFQLKNRTARKSSLLLFR